MERRKFLGMAAGALGVAAAGLVGCSDAEDPEGNGNATEIADAAASDSALPRIEWEMATSWTEAIDTIFGSVEILANRVAVLTGGKFTIVPQAAGVLSGALEVLDVVEQGDVSIGHTASYYYIAKSPAVAFGTTLPFGLTARQQSAWLFQGGGLEMMQEFYAERFGVIQFPAGNTGAQMGGWWNKEISTPADLQGLKVRMPGLGGQTMERLGAEVQNIPGGQIFDALQDGTVDAAEWVGPYDDEKLGLNEAADFYYAPGWWEPGPMLEVQVNLETWNGLPEIYQAALKTAAHEASTQMLASYDARNGQALQRLINGGTKLRTFSPDILQAAEEASFSLYDQFAQDDSDFNAIFDTWKGFREQIQQWHSLIETSYADFIASRFR